MEEMIAGYEKNPTQVREAVMKAATRRRRPPTACR